MIRVRFHTAAVAVVIMGLFFIHEAQARNTPCSQGKGGVKACMGDKYLCNDGSTSASKTKCKR